MTAPQSLPLRGQEWMHGRKMKYITSAHPDGWVVRIAYKDGVVQKYFCPKTRKRLRDAVKFRDRQLQIRSPGPFRFRHGPHKNSQSGIRGVSPFTIKRGRRIYNYWAATYKDSRGWHTRYFVDIEKAIVFRRRFETSLG